MSEYDEQAKKFLNDTNSKIIKQAIKPEVTLSPIWATKGKINHGTEYRVALVRNDSNGHFQNDYRFSFWDSIHNMQANKKPTDYDILAALTADELGSFDDYLSNYGEEITSAADYERHQETYKLCLREYAALSKMYSPDELDQLRDIQ